jgi:hypothetical protein
VTIVATRPASKAAHMEPNSFPVVSAQYPGRVTRPVPGPPAARRIATLAELNAPRIASSIRVVEPLPEANRIAIEAMVSAMTANELFEAQVLAGHVVTALVKERRRRDRERGISG